MDAGQQESERLLRQIERNVIGFYSEAKKDIEYKFNEFNREFLLKDTVKRKQLKAGEITQKEYSDWLQGQIMAGQRWQQQLDVISADLTNAHNIAQSMVNGYMPEMYAIGHNFGTYQIENIGRISTSYTLYDRQTVERLIRDNPDLLPALKPKSETARRIAEGKIKKWTKAQIQSNCLQGILQGESIPEIAERISNITMQEAKSTIRYARTMTTGAENAGRTDSYKRAEKMGIEMEQQWLATLDSRTRESHRDMDGEHVKVGEPFSNGCEYPGDPNGDPASIWNCRCTLLPMLTGIPELEESNDVSNISLRDTSHMEQQTYADWKKDKMKSQPILKQKQTGEAIKWAFIKQYREAATRLEDVDL